MPSKKLWMGFGTLAALLVLSSVAILVRVNSIEGQMDGMTNARDVSVETRQLEINVLGYALAVQECLQTRELQARQHVAQHADEEAADVERHLGEYKRLATTDRQRGMATRFTPLWKELKELGEALLEAEDPQPKQSTGFFALHDSMEDLLDDEMQAEAVERYNASREAALEYVRTIVVLALSLLVVGLATAVVTSGLVRRGVVEAEQQVEDARQTAVSIVETMREPLIVLDGKLRVVRVNRSFYQTFNVAPEETENRLLYELGNGQWNIPRLRTLLEDVLPQRTEVHDFDVEHDFPGIGQRIMRLSARRLSHGGDNGTMILLALHDVTVRERAERLVRENHELLRVTLASIGDAVITTDVQGRITYLNPVAESLTGWTQAEAVGQPLDAVFRIVNEQTRQPVESPATRALRESVIVGMANHTVLLKKDGTDQPIDDSAAPIQAEEGKVAGCVLIFRDVAERRRLEKQNADRLAATRFLASLVESSDDAIVSKSLDGLIQSWNAGAQRLFGYTAEQAVGRHISLIIPPDRLDEEEQTLGRIRAGERLDTFETVRVRSDGKPIHVSLTISPIKDEAGRIVGESRIARDITERKQAEERIYGLMTRLKEEDRRKDEFLAMLAHELRGPLAPLSNMLQIMKRGEGLADLLREARETMERQLGQMVRLVDDLLDVSRITRGRLLLRKERVELASVVHQAIETCRPLAEGFEHEVTVTLPPEPISLNADPMRLAQVFSNLLNNACKYTEPKGHVWLTAERQGRDVVVRVRDTGLGIPPDKLDSVFEMFTQVDRSLERTQGGLGIGLTLVKRLVEMHDGTVEAHSEGPGRGSEFVVRLPVLIETPKTRWSADRTASKATTMRRFLVVDDNPDSAASLAMLLKLTGNETHTAQDGIKAVEAAERFHPDVVLLDLGLPKLNGLDVCRNVREQPWGKSMVIIAVTGWGQEEDRRKSKDAGFDAHMVKPLDYDALMKLLASLPRRESQLTDAGSG